MKSYQGPPGTFRTPGLGPDKRYKNAKAKKKTSNRGGSTSSANNAAKRNMGHARNRLAI